MKILKWYPRKRYPFKLPSYLRMDRISGSITRLGRLLSPHRKVRTHVKSHRQKLLSRLSMRASLSPGQQLNVKVVECLEKTHRRHSENGGLNENSARKKANGECRNSCLIQPIFLLCRGSNEPPRNRASRRECLMILPHIQPPLQ